MSQDRTVGGEESPFVLFGECELSRHDRALLSQLLGHFGVSVEFIPREEFEDRMRLAHTTIVEPIERPVREEQPKEFSFLSVSRPDQYLVREHFEDLEEITGNTGRGLYVRVFNYLVDSTFGRGRWDDGPLIPPDLIKTKTRKELNMGPYNGRRHFSRSETEGEFYAGWAVNAGSIVEHAGTISKIDLKRRVDVHVLFIANQLQLQFED